MPGPDRCNKIIDPEERDRCLNYEGEFDEQEINVGMNRIDYAGNMNFNENSILNPKLQLPILNPMNKVKKTPSY